jgi:sirohydrochlorin cobaltochelatase
LARRSHYLPKTDLPNPASFRDSVLGGALVNELGDGEGVLLIGHGTRDQMGTDQFFQLGTLLAQRLEPVPVEPCLLELQTPTIGEAFARLVRRGAKRIHAAPLLLFSAGHAKTDIPNALAVCQAEHPGVVWDQSRPLSRCPELISLSLRRLDETLALSNAAPTRSAFIMVGRGSHDPCAQTDMKLLTQCVARRRSIARSATAFYAMATPKLPAVLAEVAACSDIDEVIIQPHLLFAGSIYQSIMTMVSQARRDHPQCRFWCGQYLGPESELVDGLIRRIQQSHAIESVKRRPLELTDFS